MAQREQEPLSTGGDLLIVMEDNEQPVLATELERDAGEATHSTADLIARQAGAADIDKYTSLAATFASASGRLVEDR